MRHYRRELEGGLCHMCDGSGWIGPGAESRLEIIPQADGGLLVTWVREHLGLGPQGVPYSEVEPPGQQAAQDPSDGRRSRHDRRQQTTPSTSSPI